MLTIMPQKQTNTRVDAEVISSFKAILNAFGNTPLRAIAARDVRRASQFVVQMVNADKWCRLRARLAWQMVEDCLTSSDEFPVAMRRTLHAAAPVGSVYALLSANAVKIGWTSGDIEKRAVAIRTAHHADVDVLLDCHGTRGDESWMHALLQSVRMQREWFQPVAAAIFGATLWMGSRLSGEVWLHGPDRLVSAGKELLGVLEQTFPNLTREDFDRLARDAADASTTDSEARTA